MSEPTPEFDVGAVRSSRTPRAVGMRAAFWSETRNAHAGRRPTMVDLAFDHKLTRDANDAKVSEPIVWRHVTINTRAKSWWGRRGRRCEATIAGK